MKSSTPYFHVNTKIWEDFQICISVPLSSRYLLFESNNGNTMYEICSNLLIKTPEQVNLFLRGIVVIFTHQKESNRKQQAQKSYWVWNNNPVRKFCSKLTLKH